MRRALDQYIRTALWSSSDESTPEGGEPMERNYGPEDLSPETLAQMRRDVEAFIAAHEEDIGEDPDELAAHDLWLTRNGHGAGFWDGDWPEPQASRLTAAAEAMGEFHLYVGDDGKIYHYS